MIEQFFTKIESLLRKTLETEIESIRQAAEQAAHSIKEGGIVHLFGCGHSHLLTAEVFYRAGGLVPVHPILHEPLMLHEGALRSSELERKNDYARRFMEQKQISPGDTMIVVSTSGKNPVPVDVALIAKEKGAYVIGITSSAYKEEKSRHKSGKLLYQCVDLTIDNHAVKGDALMEHPAVAVPFGSSSGIIGAIILQSLFTEVTKLLAEQGVTPPVLLSGNLKGVDEHNRKLIERYQHRIPNLL